MSDSSYLQALEAHRDLIDRLAALRAEFDQAANTWRSALAGGGRILLCGNGGSAAQAQHVAAELVVRLARTRPALPALALTADGVVLTAGANDFGFDQVFARQVQALARPGDLLVAISTSGRSPNVLAAVAAARAAGAGSWALVGPAASPLAAAADGFLATGGEGAARIQEAHQLVLHCLCDAAEAA